VLRAMPDAPLPALGGGSTRTADTGTVERLRAWRSRRSREDGVPAYVVCSDATLHELAATQPGTLAELASVKGFGPVKVERYGPELIAELA
jgi:DNA helicase-2/ATP-dependent DNA helicase PcrA